MKSNTESVADWHTVQLPRANLYKYEDLFWGNQRHYEDLRLWCQNTFAPGTWYSILDMDPEVGVKQFTFKNSHDRTLFILKWHKNQPVKV